MKVIKLIFLKKVLIVKNKRYLLSKEKLTIEGTSNYSLDYLNIDDVQCYCS